MTVASFLSMIAPLLVTGAEKFAPIVESWFHPATTPEEKAAIEANLADARAAWDAEAAAVPAQLASTDAQIADELKPE